MKKTILFFALFILSINIKAQSQIITDNSWLASISTPVTGWNSNTSATWTGGMTWSSPSAGVASCGFNLPTGSNPIWDNANTSLATVYFRKTFNLTSLCSTTSITIRADDENRVFVNGIQISPANDLGYSDITTYDITPYLICGENVIAIRVIDLHPEGCRYLAALIDFSATNIPLSLSPSVNHNPICEGESFTLSANANSSNQSAISYKWLSPSGGIISFSSTATINNATLLNGGTYTIQATIPCCGTVTSFIYIQVNKNPLVTISYVGGNPLCPGNQGVLTANSAGPILPISYIWNTSPIQTNQSASINSGGNYLVHAIYNNGCYRDVNMNIAQGVAVTVNPGGNFSVCYNPGKYAEPTLINLHGTVTGATTAKWGVAGNNTGTILSNSFLFNNVNATYQLSAADLANGFIIFTLTAQGPCGGVSSNITVTLNQSPNILNFAPDPTICEGQQAVIYTTTTTNTGQPMSYNWLPTSGLNNFTGAAATASPTVTTTYLSTITDINGCSNSHTFTVTVIPTFDIIITQVYKPDFCSVNPITLTATTTEGVPVEFEWNTGEHGSSIQVSVTTPTTYTVTGTNSCFTVSQSFVATPCQQLYGAFPPLQSTNGMIVGSTTAPFVVYDANLSVIGPGTGPAYNATKAKLQIFNRWGNLVFETTNTNAPKCNGFYNGEMYWDGIVSIAGGTPWWCWNCPNYAAGDYVDYLDVFYWQLLLKNCDHGENEDDKDIDTWTAVDYGDVSIVGSIMRQAHNDSINNNTKLQTNDLGSALKQKQVVESNLNFSIPNNEIEQGIIIKIYSVEGILVSSMESVSGSSSITNIKWNGLDFNGNTLRNGMYFYQVKSGNNYYSGKLIKHEI